MNVLIEQSSQTYLERMRRWVDVSIEEGVRFFTGEPSIHRKVQVLNELGLGYLTLGQSSTTLSGGEAQRVKIATELSKLQRAKHTLYVLDESSKPSMLASEVPQPVIAITSAVAIVAL